ncbi:hypothetical protein EDD37DRAFT_613346 [Exophiala viscosa]|uniref:uncharacterized protein n=1 Tax=Exophiala viscosa TaxID=2486360 RepID=UPI0021965287|nr:hypothetical protein EDD37DRAFT_613346 [Exophiala viscosa]
MKGIRRNSPVFQNFIMGCMLFCLPGIYVAITGLGAGGGKSTSQVTSSDANTILYGMFTLFGWLGGSILNIFRPKITAVFGAIGYPLYIGGLWYYDRTEHPWFVLFAGAMLGMTAGCLWTTTGYVSYVYPQEKEKGTKVHCDSVHASFFGLNSGSLCAFGGNVHETSTKGVSDGVYITFIVIMCCAILIGGIFIVDPRKVVRDDGTHIAIFKKEKPGKELMEMLKVFVDKRILLLTPAIFCGEMASALVSSINSYYFNLRTRCLNNAIYQIIQIIIPFVLSFFLDTKFVKHRRTRGYLGIAFIGTITLCSCAGLTAFIVENGLNKHTSPKARGNDWSDPGFAKAFVIYLFWGMVYSGYQIVVEWVLAALTNDPAVLARYSGLFKGKGSLGIMVSFLLDSRTVPYIWQLTLQFVLYTIGIIGMVVVTKLYIPDTNYFSEESVVVPHQVEEMAKLGGMVTEEQINHEFEKERRAAQLAEGHDIEITPA